MLLDSQPMLIQSFLSRSDVKGARSTALYSLQWALALLLAAIPVTVYSNAPEWLLMLLSVAVIVVLVVFLIAYIFLLVRNPDALRSEQFTLSKLAIEKGLVGDNVTGLTQAQLSFLPSARQTDLESDEGGRV